MGTMGVRLGRVGVRVHSVGGTSGIVGVRPGRVGGTLASVGGT